ncbi:hypothetical protein BDV95DRAFT_607909 [Massariosphaeria phaeospora]|uniref:AAA+ ATPase domain-containing protein n=1 Tax=Massariosphaeria phaeospora TaxID=100035 RepID=A0A7C8M7G3_9PLEO|nr:hypothetical protein BDV95DRAFT_607909 [Massariosphaeria phaeospora]
MNKQGPIKTTSDPASTSPSQSLPVTQKLSSDTTSSSPSIVPTPASVTSLDNEPEDHALTPMEAGEGSKEAAEGTTANLQVQQDKSAPALEGGTDGTVADQGATKKSETTTGKRKGKRKTKDTKEEGKKESDNETDSDSDSDDESSSTEDERKKKRQKKKAALKKAAEKKKNKEKAKEKAKAKAKAKAKGKKKAKHGSSSEEFSSESSSSSSSDDSDSESEHDKKKRKLKLKSKAKARKKSKKHDSSSDESSSDSSSDSSSSSDNDSDSEDDKKKRRKAKAKKRKTANKKSRKAAASSDSSDSQDDTDGVAKTTADAAATETATDDATRMMKLMEDFNAAKLLGIPPPPTKKDKDTAETSKKADKKKKSKKNGLEYKRVDQVWDPKIRDYKYTESAEEQKDDFDCVFSVRRKFGWENKHEYTMVDIKSKLLRGALQVVFKDCKGLSLVEETPSITPHTLFLYYDELKHYYKKTLKSQLKKSRKSKEKKRIAQQISQCKLLAGYIDEDYDSVRKTLKPMLKSGTITWDLIWALFKPNTIAFTPTYGNKDDPRCFRVDWTYDEEDFMGNHKWLIDGRYLEYNGKIFGLGSIGVEIPLFKGPKKITNLPVYPLKFHKDPEGLEQQLIERGKKFVSLQGMNYRFHKGLAYMKVKRSVVKVNVNGRVMVDPAIFRRINPNYPLSYIKQDELNQDSDDDDSDDDCCCSDEEDDSSADDRPKMKTVLWKDRKGRKHLIRIPAGDKQDISGEKLDSVDEADGSRHVFTEEELLISSPVVLGFSFSEKLWIEFSLSGIQAIEWNSQAFDQLVLAANIKQNLQGLVSSHRFHAAKTIDDVIRGKGKGLNVVLHGPPGVGKTLTGESIAEFLQCPLYAVSAGELGTSSRALEADLNRIMDITHSWGAILLLDEADVFLEARQPHDLHRNALVSVFLRLLEYYQGILFLTTNRVETFDEAFQSRIHMGIRYENLTPKARREVWVHHVRLVERMAGGKARPFRDADFDELAKRDMNGRQIKNTVKTSQSIALAEKQVFGMEHVKRVLEVAEAFDDDMRGGMGYRDVMRQYT